MSWPLPPASMVRTTDLLEAAPPEMADLGDWLLRLPLDQFMLVGTAAAIDAATRPFSVAALAEVLRAIEARWIEASGVMGDEPGDDSDEHGGTETSAAGGIVLVDVGPGLADVGAGPVPGAGGRHGDAVDPGAVDHADLQEPGGDRGPDR